MLTVLNPLKQRRTEAGLTITRLAEKSHVSQPTIRSLERGRHNATPLTIRKLAAALACTYTELGALERQAG